MKTVVGPLLVVLALVPAYAVGADGVAIVLGEEIGGVELVQAEGGPAQAARLLDLVWRRVARHYVERNGLAATAAEVAELAAYHREFDRKDRAQRARKIQQLNQRLAADGLKAEERAWLEEFRAVLRRLERRDAENERSPPPDPAQQATLLTPWVEMWKMNRALYEEYGGVVALTRFGPDPHGARRALIEDYERRGLLKFSDASLRERLFARLSAPPSMIVAPGEVDFTPYWKRPIPPSYFPD